MLRILCATAGLVLLATFAAPAAPAAGGSGPVPKAVEFELRAPGAAAGVAANRGYVADPVRAGKRFNLVGLSWRGDAEPAIAVRARRDGGEWTRWTPASHPGEHGPEARSHERSARGTSEPVWVGHADWVQYRASRRVPGLRLHFVNTTGTATAADRAATRQQRRLARAGAKKRRARPAVSRPRIRSRAQWGAAQCPTRRVSYGGVRAAIVHHTVTANTYTRKQTPAAILAICRFHRNTNGWNDIGYNFIVDRFGRIWEGRAGGVDEAVAGSHAQGYNSQTTGISNLGTFTAVPQTDRAIAGMARLIAWKLGNHGIRTYGRPKLTSLGGSSARYPYGDRRRFERIMGHRDTGRTACPGTQLYYQLPELRERIGERRPTGLVTEMEAPLPELVTFTRAGYTFGGRLTDAAGAGIAGRTVELEKLRRKGWKRMGEATTDADGAFSVGTRFKRNTVVRWKFAGDELYRPFRGDGVAVTVVPEMTLSASATEVAPDERIDLSGTLFPRKSGELALVIERDESGVWREVARRKVLANRGSFTKRRRFAEEGRYRLSVEFAGDARNAPGLSPHVEITVANPLFPF